MDNHININEEIKILAIRKGLTISELVKKLNESGLKIGSRQNLYKKFTRQSLKFNEIQDILDFLGYKIEIKPK